MSQQHRKRSQNDKWARFAWLIPWVYWGHLYSIIAPNHIWSILLVNVAGSGLPLQTQCVRRHKGIIRDSCFINVSINNVNYWTVVSLAKRNNVKAVLRCNAYDGHETEVEQCRQRGKWLCTHARCWAATIKMPCSSPQSLLPVWFCPQSRTIVCLADIAQLARCLQPMVAQSNHVCQCTPLFLQLLQLL